MSIDRFLHISFLLLCCFAMLHWPDAVSASDQDSTDDQYRRILEKATLSKNGDVEILVREHVYPPGGQAPTHYHDGDLFIYVVSGHFEVVTEEGVRAVYESGDAMQMAADTVMDARNLSSEKPLKLVVFQVGEPDGPFLVPVD